MAAVDTFEWFIANSVPEPDPGMEKYIRQGREYLLTLRSEDERRRFVDNFLAEVRERSL
jgi:hypothetical protein